MDSKLRMSVSKELALAYRLPHHDATLDNGRLELQLVGSLDAAQVWTGLTRRHRPNGTHDALHTQRGATATFVVPLRMQPVAVRLAFVPRVDRSSERYELPRATSRRAASFQATEGLIVLLNQRRVWFADAV